MGGAKGSGCEWLQKRAQLDPSALDDAAGLRAIASLLHDGVAQELFATSMSVEDLLQASDLPEEVRCGLEQIADQLFEAGRGMRFALRSLLAGHVPRSEQGSTVDRIRRRVEEFRDRFDIPVDLEIEGNGPEPGAAAADLLVRSVKEGLVNIVKHAQATRALVIVRRADSWAIEVHDDGVGRPGTVYDALSSRELAFGLATIRADASRVAGRMCLSDARWPQGLCLMVSVPVTSSGSG